MELQKNYSGTSCKPFGVTQSLLEATLVDENIKFFHSTATIRKNKNGIRSLIDEQGLEKFGHDEKASILWESFRSRLGVYEFTHMYFNLSSLLHRTDNMHILEEHFSHEEINGIIKNLLSEKSLGPDGFNSNFMKKCWTTISADFYDLCLAFYDHNINIQSINGSYITLIPKKQQSN
jgi:hypothetical protein